VKELTLEQALQTIQRTSRKSKERRLALKRLHRAHIIALDNLSHAMDREAHLLATLQALQQETKLLRSQLHKQSKVPSKSWWPSSDILRGE